MNFVRLGDVAVINPTWDESAGLDEPVSFVGMASMSDEAGKTIDEEARTVGQVRKGFTPFRRDDLLVAKITPCFENGKIGRAAIRNRLGAGSTEFHVVRPGKDLDGAYALHFLRRPSFRTAGELRMTGSGGQRRVPAAYVADAKIPLPPLDEQRRIAAILDKADELRAKRREALAHVNTLAQSIYEDIECQADAMPRMKLSEVCSRIQTGPFGSLLHKEDYVDAGIPLVNPMHIRDGMIFADPSFSVSDAKFDQLDGYRLLPGDVVLGRRGELGRCAVVKESHGPMLCGTGSLIVRPSLSRLSPTYLSAVLSSRSVKGRLSEVAQGATMLNLNTKIVGSLEIPLPPLELQQAFATRVAAVERLKEMHRKHLAELDTLFASLQHRAFKGEPQ